MTELKIITSPEFDAVFANYPDTVRDKMKYLRSLVLETVKEMPTISKLEETLKWGEPSFITKHGSTLRMDWKKKTPNQYAMYFKCTSRLVKTFKEVFGNHFQYEKNRAIVFQLDQEVPVRELKQCIKATLQYHKVKDDPTLGI
ncbi:MAG: DUF1801 domain-containing protein [Saprospiraceae bacterium]